MGGRATGSQSNTGVGKIAVWGEGMIGISWRVLSNWAAPLSVCCQPAHRKRIEEAFGWHCQENRLLDQSGFGVGCGHGYYLLSAASLSTGRHPARRLAVPSFHWCGGACAEMLL
jgi:hypothetical protein